MKNISLTAFGLLCLNICQAQHPNKTFIYGEVSSVVGSQFGLRASLSCLVEKHHEISFGYNFYSRNSPHTHNNEGNLNPFDLFVPQQTYSGAMLTYSYILYPRRHLDLFRWKLGGGLGYGLLATLGDLVATGINSFSTEIHHQPQPSISLNAGLQFTPTRGFGLSAGTFALLSDAFSGGGISFGILFGEVGNHRGSRKPETEEQMLKRLERDARRKERRKMQEMAPENPYP